MGSFFNDNVGDAGKLPFFLCVVTFIVTFVVTRIIVRMIRSGRGPFRDNTVGGVHVHHMVPGLFLLIIGGLIAIGAVGPGWDSAAGVIFGMGLALVLDEFALVLHLDDVYWSEEGRLSVDVVFVIGAVMILLLLVGSPFGVHEDSVHTGPRLVSLLIIAVDLSMAAVAASKGKLVMAALGIVVPVIGWVGAIRLARPNSPFARRRYPEGSEKMARASDREERFDATWRSRVTRFQEKVAGVFGPNA